MWMRYGGLDMDKPAPFHAPATILNTIEEMSLLLDMKRDQERERRKLERKELHVSCVVQFFGKSNFRTCAIGGRTRNISRRGMGILVKRCFYVGEPIEVWIQPQDRSPLHAAGLVRFCRYVVDGIFEVGIELMYAGDAPIFGDDATRAVEQLPWLAEALARRGDSMAFRTRDPARFVAAGGS